MKTLALWILVAGLLVAACAAPLATVTTPAPVATPEPTPTSAPVETADPPAAAWQSYVNDEAGFRIDYPSHWTQETLPDQNDGLLKGVALRGPEGSVELYWGVGFGGACPDGYQPLTVAQGELSTCYAKNADGTENWEQIYTQLGDVTFGGRAFTSNADPASREAILASLATLTFDQWTPPAAQAAQPDLAAICPAETEGTTLHVSPENGWCFLYPSSLRLEPDMFRPEEAVNLMGEPLDPDAMESVAVNLTVANNGPADGLDSAQYANTWLDLNLPGMDLLEQHATIGGQPAVIYNNLPGFFAQRGAFIVANDVKYQIVMQPQPGDVPELAEQASLAWDTVTQSIVFFPPQNERVVMRPADVCPEEKDGATLRVNLVDGYCLLLPEGFAVDPNFPARIVGGPEYGPVKDFDSVRASLAVGAYALGEQTPEQALQPISEQIDTKSVQPATIAGYPAVVFDFTGGPWRQRNAQIVVGDWVYTFVGQPWDAVEFPEALADLELLWDAAADSIAFFDRWR
ncbi:MAG TPA: hypothetical protein VL334_16030 [Anaerolineae bacterium]|nr:hypothetical protein [Anaerolineae bacterium]